MKEEVLVEASTALSVTKIDIAKSSNQLEAEQVNLDTALKQSLSLIESRPEQKRAFKMECKQVIIVLIQKLKERCPLKHSIVRNSSALSPNSMVEEKFQGLVEWLCKLKWLTADEADDAKQQFDEFVNTECPKHWEKFASFDKLSDAVNVFLSNFIHKIPKYKVFWKVCSVIFLLSHDQSTVERGFSINKEFLVENLQEKLSVSQRMVYNHINSEKINIHEYKLSSHLLKKLQVFQRSLQCCPRRNQETRENWYSTQKTKIDQQGYSSYKEEKGGGNQMYRSFENGCWQVVNRSWGKSKFTSSYKG